jgi:hypothetical protein
MFSLPLTAILHLASKRIDGVVHAPTFTVPSAFVYCGQNGCGQTPMKLPVAAHWAALDDHFQRHTRMVECFRHANADAVTRMWKYQINEQGQRLSEFEREALIERHCELYGSWPQ